MTNARTGRALAALLLTTVGLIGCGGESGQARARGRITYKGQPVPSGTVYFTPVTAGQRAAQGTLDAQGYFTLGTNSTNDGALIGKHRVSVVAQGPDKPIPAKKKGQMMAEDMQGTGDPLVPKRYFSPTTANLDAEVTSGGANNFEFDLKD